MQPVAKKRTAKRVVKKRAAAAKKTAKKKAKKAVKKAVKKVAKSAAKKAAGRKAGAAKKTKASAAKKKTTKKVVAAKKKTKRKTAVKRKPVAAKPKLVPAVVATPKPKKQKSGLRSRDIAEFRGMLLDKRAQLIGNVNNLHAEAMRTDSAGDMSSMPIHMADIGTDNYEQEFTLGLIESERAILQEIEDALQRMADKTYGLCVGTGMPIGKKRLKANPWAKYSYEYKLAQEKGMTRRF